MSTTTLPDTRELTGTYTIDPAHSRIGFVARHAMVTKVRGSFNEFEGHVEVAEEIGDSSAEVTIQATSVDTRNADRDEHLRSNDFFAMEQYPEIRFVSTEIEQVGDTDFRVTGDLTLRGVTRPVTFELEFTGAATDPWGNTRVGLEGSTKVNRRDWGLTWNTPLDGGGILVSDTVTLEFEISATKDA